MYREVQGVCLGCRGTGTFSIGRRRGKRERERQREGTAGSESASQADSSEEAIVEGGGTRWWLSSNLRTQKLGKRVKSLGPQLDIKSNFQNLPHAMTCCPHCARPPAPNRAPAAPLVGGASAGLGSRPGGPARGGLPRHSQEPGARSETSPSVGAYGGVVFSTCIIVNTPTVGILALTRLVAPPPVVSPLSRPQHVSPSTSEWTSRTPYPYKTIQACFRIHGCARLSAPRTRKS